MNKCLLKDVAKIDISNVDKKSLDTETPVRLCNFTDVYNNWEITEETCKGLMLATAKKSEIEKFGLRNGMLAITKDSETRNDIGMATHISCSLDNIVLGYHTALIVPDNTKIDSGYLIAYLRSNISRKYFSDSASGSGQRYTLTLESIENLPIYCPSLEEQAKIGRIFSLVNQRIEKNNIFNSELESLAKTIYDYWFLQFEFLNEAGEPYMSSGGKMVWNEELKQEIPEGWEVKQLNDCVEDILDRRGVTPKKLGGDWTENGIKALSAKTVKSGKLVNLNEANQVSEEMYQKWMPHDLMDGDILMTSEAPLGEFYFILDDEKYCLSQRLFAIRSNDLASSIYLYFELSQGYGYSQIIRSQSGSTVFGIRQDELRKIKVLLPNLELQTKFENIVLPMFHMIKKGYAENRTLSSLRDFLLPLLMNGQVGFKKDGDR